MTPIKKISPDKTDTKIRILEATWHLMEKGRGHGISMSNIAKEAGISRQALYLHFDSRIELVTATVHYVDEVKGLNKRLEKFDAASSGTELLEILVSSWGNYIPEIYGLARAMLNTRDTDEATAAAWNNCMTGIKNMCERIVITLDKENQLIADWSTEEAVNMFRTILSIQVWEQLTIENGWSTDQYINRMQTLLRNTLIQPTIQK